MPEFKPTQLQDERDTWKRILGYMKVENIYLKYSLAEILKNNIANNSLKDIEDFHFRFLKQDEFNTMLAIEISGLDKFLSRYTLENDGDPGKVKSKIDSVRNDIECAELQFSRLKSEFSDYVSKKLIYD